MTGIVKRETSLPSRPTGSRLSRVAETVTEFLVFRLGEERMGLPLESVQEILKPVTPTRVPRAGPDILGIVSVRGRITTVIDLRRRLGLDARDATRLTRVLLVDGGAETLGLVVDEVLHVVRLREDEIENASTVALDLPEHVLGLGRPRRGRDGTRGGADSGALATASDAEVIVLLDPVSLLRR